MSLGLLAAGRRVVAFDIDRARPAMDELVGLAHGAGQSERLFPVYGSVRSEDDCARVVAAAIERFGRVDALVNNAGLGMGTISLQAMISGIPFYDVPAENWRALIDTNVNGPFLMAKAITPHLRKQGWGRIVNVTTSYPTMIKDGFSPYGPAKAALEAASVIWSNDLKGTGVTVNVLIPGGAADTPMVPYEAARDRTKLVPPHVMVAPVTWLSSRVNGIPTRRSSRTSKKPVPLRAGAARRRPASPLERTTQIASRSGRRESHLPVTDEPIAPRPGVELGTEKRFACFGN